MGFVLSKAKMNKGLAPANPKISAMRREKQAYRLHLNGVAQPFKTENPTYDAEPKLTVQFSAPYLASISFLVSIVGSIRRKEPVSLVSHLFLRVVVRTLPNQRITMRRTRSFDL